MSQVLVSFNVDIHYGLFVKCVSPISDDAKFITGTTIKVDEPRSAAV